MNAATKDTPRYGTATSRWAGIGPYYGMFPTAFTDWAVAKYTRPGDTVIDPFAGRGAATFSAAIAGRSAVGVDINPLAYVYANAKLKPSGYQAVIRRLEVVAEAAGRYRAAAAALPAFFQYCYSPQVREFLLAARANLNWRRANADRVLMALILISLHGKQGSALSNQMRQTTAMAPDYCIRWWREQETAAPDVDPVAFLAKRIAWRYTHGAPQTGNAAVYLGDSRRQLLRLTQQVQEGNKEKAKFLITSPPYHNVTNYYYDQWLRIWLLGGPGHPTTCASNQYGGKFSNQLQYRQLLTQVFAKCKSMLTDDAVIYVRTDARESTYWNTKTALELNFPEKRITEQPCPVPLQSQTKGYSRGGSPKKVNREIDLVLEPG